LGFVLRLQNNFETHLQHLLLLFVESSQETTPKPLKLKRSTAFHYEDVGVTPKTFQRLVDEGIDFDKADAEDIQTAIRLDKLRASNSNPVSKVLDMME